MDYGIIGFGVLAGGPGGGSIWVLAGSIELAWFVDIWRCLVLCVRVVVRETKSVKERVQTKRKGMIEGTMQ